MLSLNLTPRRQETLATLQRLNLQAGSAVHYSLVASSMRISAWTAYGLLRELERMGLVARSYALEPGKRLGGRSRILFAAARQAGPALGLEEARAALAAALERFAAVRDEAAAARLYLREAGGDLAFQVGFWLSRLEGAGRGAAEAAAAILDGGAGPRLTLQSLAGAGLGATLARLQRGTLPGRITAAANRFTLLLDDAGRASDAQLAALVEAARSLQPAPRRRLAP